MTEVTSVPDSPARITSKSVVAFFAADHVALTPDAKLYVNGGFYNLLRFPAFPAVLSTLGVGAVVEIPFQDTMQEHVIRIGLRGPDGHDLPVRVEARFRTALSWEAQFGDPGLVPFGVTVTNVEIPTPGIYDLMLWLDNVEQKTYRIQVTQTPGVPSVGPAASIPQP
jgi:hypothetical protein